LILGIELAASSMRMKKAYLGLVALVCLAQFALTFSPSFLDASRIRRYANGAMFSFRHDQGFEVFQALLGYFRKEILETRKDIRIVSFAQEAGDHLCAELHYAAGRAWVLSPTHGDLADAALRKDTDWEKTLRTADYIVDTNQPWRYAPDGPVYEDFYFKAGEMVAFTQEITTGTPVNKASACVGNQGCPLSIEDLYIGAHQVWNQDYLNQTVTVYDADNIKNSVTFTLIDRVSRIQVGVLNEGKRLADGKQKFMAAFAAHPGLFQEAARFTFANAYQVVVYKKIIAE